MTRARAATGACPSPTRPARCARPWTRPTERSWWWRSAAGCWCGRTSASISTRSRGSGRFLELEAWPRHDSDLDGRAREGRAAARRARDRGRRAAWRASYSDLLLDAAGAAAARRRRGDAQRPRAVLGLQGRRGAAHAAAARSTPAPTWRTPPIRRASARRPRRSARSWRGRDARSPRWRWWPSGWTSARPAAAAASACPSSAGPETPVYLGRPGGPLETTTLASCCRCRSTSRPRELARGGRGAGASARGCAPRVGVVLGLGPGRRGRVRGGAGRGRLRGAAGLPAAARGGTRRDGPCSAGSAACRWRCCRAGPTSTRAGTPSRCARRCARCGPPGAEILVLTNAAGSLRPEVGPGPADADHRPHQHERHERAHRPERRRARPALPEPARRLRPGAAERARAAPRASWASGWPRASTWR